MNNNNQLVNNNVFFLAVNVTFKWLAGTLKLVKLANCITEIALHYFSQIAASPFFATDCKKLFASIIYNSRWLGTFLSSWGFIDNYRRVNANSLEIGITGFNVLCAIGSVGASEQELGLYEHSLFGEIASSVGIPKSYNWEDLTHLAYQCNIVLRLIDQLFHGNVVPTAKDILTFTGDLGKLWLIWCPKKIKEDYAFFANYLPKLVVSATSLTNHLI